MGRSNTVYPAAGFELQQPFDDILARVVLRFVLALPERWRDNVLFGRSRAALPLQRAVQRVLGSRREVQIRYTEGPARGNLFQCWSDEKYFFVGSGIERKVGRVLELLITPSSTIYDVGAHAGFWALAFSTMAGSNGHVFAFEPSKINFERLSRNLRLNARTNITAVNLGASDMEGRIPFSDAGSYSHIGRNVARRFNPEAGIEAEIDVVTLDDFIYRDSHPEPNVLFVDVEGHAGNVLRGARRLLGAVHPEIVCEIHDAQEHKAVLAETSGNGYKPLPIDSESEFPRRVRFRPVASSESWADARQATP